MERDPGGQKDLSNAQVQAQIRQAIFNQKEQMLRAVFSEVSRNNAQVKNYLAERLLETGGKSAPASGTAKTEEDQTGRKEGRFQGGCTCSNSNGKAVPQGFRKESGSISE